MPTETTDDAMHRRSQTLVDLTHACALAASDPQSRGEYEHVREARAVLLLMRGHASALHQLVTLGPQFYASGWPIARNMFEVSIRTAWRMFPEDPWIGEARWLAWLKRYVDYQQRDAEAMDRAGHPELSHAPRARADLVNRFCTSFQAKLDNQGVAPAKRDPSMKGVLADLGLTKHHYQVYAEASERIHGNYLGLDAWTRHLGAERVYGDFATWSDWLPPLNAAFSGQLVLAATFRRRTETPALDEALRKAVADWGLG